MLLLDNPEAWLCCFELAGDLDAEAPAHGRLFENGLYNQFVVNRNLVLEEHTDNFNHQVLVTVVVAVVAAIAAAVVAAAVVAVVVVLVVNICHTLFRMASRRSS